MVVRLRPTSNKDEDRKEEDYHEVIHGVKATRALILHTLLLSFPGIVPAGAPFLYSLPIIIQICESRFASAASPLPVG